MQLDTNPLATAITSFLESDAAPVAAEPATSVPVIPDAAETLAAAAIARAMGTEVVEPAVEPAVETAPAEVPAPAATEADATALPEITLDDDDFDSMPDPSMPSVFDLNTPRGQRIYAAHKFVKQLAAPPEQGGIGHEPTVDDIRQYHAAHLNFERFMGDLGGDPKILAHNLYETDPNAVIGLATTLPDFIAERNPQAYEVLAKGVGERWINSIVDSARGMQDQKARDAWLYVAEGLKYHLSEGRERLDPNVMNQPAADPLAAREQQLRARETEIDRFNRQQHEQQIGGFHQTLIADTTTALTAEIEKQLAPVKGKLPEAFYQGTIRDILTKVQNAVRGNTTAWNSIQVEMRKAGRVIGNPASEQAQRAAIVNRYVQFARPAISVERAEALKGFKVKVAVSAADAAKAAPAPAAGRPLPGGSPAGTAAKQNSNVTTTPAAGMSNTESILRQIHQAVAS